MPKKWKLPVCKVQFRDFGKKVRINGPIAERERERENGVEEELYSLVLRATTRAKQKKYLSWRAMLQKRFRGDKELKSTWQKKIILNFPISKMVQFQKK